MIPFDEFKKIELRIGKVLHAERVEGSSKLLKLNVNAGEDRQIIAGIGAHYSPEDLMGKEIVIVANLEPRMIMGLESQGMLLAAHGEGPVILHPEKEVPPGAIIS